MDYTFHLLHVSHSHGLSPLASLKLWAFLHALLVYFGWYGTFQCMMAKEAKFAIQYQMKCTKYIRGPNLYHA